MPYDNPMVKAKMTKAGKGPGLADALRAKGEEYAKKMPMDMEEEMPGEEEKADDVSAMAEKVETLSGPLKDAAIDALITKLQSMKGAAE